LSSKAANTNVAFTFYIDKVGCWSSQEESWLSVRRL